VETRVSVDVLMAVVACGKPAGVAAAGSAEGKQSGRFPGRREDRGMQ